MFCAWSLGPLAVFAQTDLASTLPEQYFPALKRLLDSAVKQAPEVIGRELEVELSQARTYAADAPRLPRLGGEIRFDSSQSAVSGSNSRTNRDNGLFYHVDLNQSLFHWGALKNNSARSRIGIAIAEKRYQDAYRVLALGLRQTFLELVSKRAALHQLRYEQKLRTDDLKAAEEALELGLVSRGEVAGLQIVSQAKAIELDRLEAEFVARCRTLSRIAGAPPLQESEIPLEIPDMTYSPELTKTLLADFLRSGVRDVPEVDILEMNIKDQTLAYQIARVQNLPKFGASAGHSVENTTNVSGQTVDQQGVERQTISVKADLNIFDGFATKGAKQEALKTKRIYERQLATTTDRLMEEAQRSEDVLDVERRAVAMADQQRALAAADLEIVKDEVQRGNIPGVRVDQATGTLNFRTAEQVAARARLLGEWSAFVSLVGVDPAMKNISARYAR